MKTVKFLQPGFSLLEVVIGLFIFTTGMLALAALQGQLTRSQADAAVRSVATNIAEEQIELVRGFGLIDNDPDNSIPAYTDIQDRSLTVSRGNIDFAVTIDVTDYYYDLVSDSFGTAIPDSIGVSDYKNVTFDVSWGETPDFQISESQSISADDIGTGGIQLTAIISSITTQAAARSVTQREKQPLLPDVGYTPGLNPDIVSLQLGETRFKESTSPVPRVFRSEERVETRFDVITYSQTNSGALFLRREEFIGVSCDCRLEAPPTDPGHQQTLTRVVDYQRSGPVMNTKKVTRRSNPRVFQPVTSKAFIAPNVVAITMTVRA